MGGVIDGGGGIGTKASPHQESIEKALAELRLEYDVREERRRELQFLEKGGNPLDFKFELTAAVSFHSTSFVGQNPDQIVISEAKGSFALTASPQGERGDSVESSGRLGITVAGDPNSADNFDGDHGLVENERNSVYPSRSNITASGHSSHLDMSQNVKESETSPISHHKKGQAYRRRNRSRITRDGARSSSTNIPSCPGHAYSLPVCHAVVSRASPSDSQLDAALEGLCAVNATADLTNDIVPEGKLEVSNSKDFQINLHIASAKADKTPTVGELDFGGEEEHKAAGCVECPPCPAVKKNENDGSEQLDELENLKGDGKGVLAEGILNNFINKTKGLDFESSCTHTSVSVDGNGIIDSDVCNLKKENNNRAPEEYMLVAVEKSDNKDQSFVMDMGCCRVNEQSDQFSGFTNTDKEELHRSHAQSELKPLSNTGESELELKSDIKQDSKFKSTCSEQLEASQDLPFIENMESSVLSIACALEVVTCKKDQPNAVDKEHEDRILEEAYIIEAKRKRIAQLSIGTLPKDFCRKSQWDFVLEEMAWLANDFAQERLWKLTSAAQLGHLAAFASRLKVAEQSKWGNQKFVANTLANAVMEFWQEAALLVTSQGLESGKDETVASRKSYEVETASSRINILDKGLQYGKNKAHGLQGYAVGFLQSNANASSLIKVEASGVPERAYDTEMIETSFQDQFTEENLFYTVPPGVMEAYRKSIAVHLEQYEKIGNSVQGEVDMSMYDAVSVFCSQENVYDEDDRDNQYYLPGTFDGSREIRFAPRKGKNTKSYAARSYQSRGDLPHGHCAENRISTPQSTLMGKRSAYSLNVAPIPTKRVRTASRQRVVGPFYGGSAGFMPARSRNDASSGDTNSFQDDHSSLHGRSIIPKGSEVDSGMDFDKQYAYDSAEISAKARKKKKTKHQGTIDLRWQIDSTLQSDQKDQLKKRLDNHQFESNGSSGLFGQFAKKPKVLKQSLDNSVENATPISGSIDSPVASQMSNMSNPSKLIKLIGGQDRSRKAKALKVPMGQPGLGSPWSLFEDQALVVLVHDMGPNWELVSNAINSTLHFKCVFRKPRECKERHKALMDRTSGDGADSADDSGSSQPYPSTLPGIPKGSAMQLFQRLQGPMEEDAIKSHFEKIISIGKHLHYRRKKNDAQDLKQLLPVHGSHAAALSQVMPNNVNGGVLTPLDLCDTGASSPDLLTLGGYQGPFSGTLTLSHQGAPSLLSSSGASTSIQSSPGVGIGGSLISPSAQLNGSNRDSRYSVPRANLRIDDQQRLQQYNMLSSRNIQQSNGTGPVPVPGTDRGVRMLPGGGGMGIMSGLNRSRPMSRPGFQGIPSSSMHSGNMVVSNIGMSRTAKVPHRASAVQGNSMKAHGALHVVGIGQNPEQKRQMMSPDLQMQVTQACSQGVPPFSGTSSTFPDLSASPPVQPYVHHQQHQVSQQHPNVLSNPHHSHLQRSSHLSPQDQQAYALRLARERQLHQRMLQQRRQPFPASSALMSQLPTSNQVTVSSSLQNNMLIQSHGSSQPVSFPSVAPPSARIPAASEKQKPQLLPQGLGRSTQGLASGVTTQMGKQRRQSQQLPQQYQKSGRHHPQLCPQPQQSKPLKEMGRGNVLMHPSLPADHSHRNGLSGHPGNPVMEKGEQAMHMTQAQSLYSVSGLQPFKPLLSTQPSSQSHAAQQQYSTFAAAPSQLAQQISSHPDSSKQSQVTAAPLSDSNHGLSSSAMPSINHQQLQVQSKPPTKFVNHSQPAINRATQQHRQSTVDSLTKLQSDQAHMDPQYARNSIIPSATSPSCIDSTNVIPLLSSANSAHCKAPDISIDLVIENSSTQIGPTSFPPPASTPRSELLPSNGHPQGQGELSGSSSPQGKNVETQWREPSQKQSQQQHQDEQSPLRQQQQLPQQQIQVGQSSMLTRTTNSRLE